MVKCVCWDRISGSNLKVRGIRHHRDVKERRKGQSTKTEYPKGKGYIVSRLEASIECIKNNLLEEARHDALEAIDSIVELEEKNEPN